MAPVFEKIFGTAKQAFGISGAISRQAAGQNEAMTAGARDGYGVELEIAQAGHGRGSLAGLVAALHRPRPTTVGQ